MIQLDTLGTVDLRRDGEAVRAVLVQPRRLALLAWLATVRPRGFHSRDRVQGIFWAESDQERARNSLRQALHHLRRALGDDVILARGDREVSVNPDLLHCDAAEFDAAIEAGRLEDALTIYRGEFLPGFFLDNAPEAEQFIEAARERYRMDAVAAAWKLVTMNEERGELAAAIIYARRGLAIDPHDEAGLRRAVELCAAAGDRVAGLRLYEEFARRMEEDLELSPSEETRRLVERLRSDSPPASAVVEKPPGRADVTLSPAVPQAPRSRSWLRATLGATALLAIMVVTALFWRREPVPPAAPVDGEVSTIAVLPFVNITGDPSNEYLADGLTDELTAALARVPGLNVAGHTSAFTFKGRDVAFDSIGRALNVAHVLEGSIRVTGSRVRIVAALIDTRTGFHAWSDTYQGEMDDVLSMQDRIARAIVNELRPRFRPSDDAPIRPGTVSAEAHADLLRGLQALRSGGPEDVAVARRWITSALAKDTAYADAYAAMAGLQMTEAMTGRLPRREGYDAARRNAERALALDPRGPDAHVVLGRIAQDYEWDFAAADRHFLRAIELSPGLEMAYRQRARLLSVLRRHDEAITLARRATELDPLAAGAHRYLGLMLYYAGQVEASLEAFTRAIALAPDQAYGLVYQSFVLSRADRHPEALAAIDRAVLLAPDDPVVIAGAGEALAAAGDTARARAQLAKLMAKDPSSSFLAAEVLACIGDRDGMYSMLERAATERDPFLTEVNTVPVFDPFRADARMRRLIARIGLPEATE